MVNKRLFLLIYLIIIMLTATGCTKTVDKKTGLNNSTQDNNKIESKKGDVDNDICKQFDADFIYSVLNKPVVKVEQPPLKSVFGCHYYFDYKEDFYKLPNNTVQPGGSYVSIILDNLSYENQKKGNEVLERKLSTSEKIKMEHFIATQENGLINTIVIDINPSRFVSVNRSSGQVITNDEQIDLAAKIAEKIQGQLTLEIKKNPVELKAEEVSPVGDSQQAVADNFLKLLADKKIDEALNMMDANSQTKAMWRTNFTTIKSLKVNKIEEAFKEEWTSQHQVFKVELEVQVTNEGTGYGWENGKNFRWIFLQPNNSIWQIHEIANNP
jgi:hypothetical protein